MAPTRAPTSQPWTRPHRAVLDAYGWPHDLSDEAILTRLLTLSGERVAGQEQRASQPRRPACGCRWEQDGEEGIAHQPQRACR